LYVTSYDGLRLLIKVKCLFKLSSPSPSNQAVTTRTEPLRSPGLNQNERPIFSIERKDNRPTKRFKPQQSEHYSYRPVAAVPIQKS